MHVVGVADLDVARARSQLKTAGWPDGAIRRQIARRRAQERARPSSPTSAAALIADPRIEVIVEATGVPGAGIHHALAVNRQRQAHRHGQCRSRRGGRSAAGAPRQGGRRGLLARLGRPAGADLRARRLGARRRLQGDLRRQGHALRAALPQVQSRQCLGHPRQVPEHLRPQVDQSEDVQLLRRRHQVRHRDDRGVQRHRPGAADRTACISRRRRASSLPTSASRRATAARWRKPASPR